MPSDAFGGSMALWSTCASAIHCFWAAWSCATAASFASWAVAPVAVILTACHLVCSLLIQFWAMVRCLPSWVSRRAATAFQAATSAAWLVRVSGDQLGMSVMPPELAMETVRPVLPLMVAVNLPPLPDHLRLAWPLKAYCG